MRPLTIRGKVIFIYFSSTNYTSTMEQEASGSTPLFAVFLLSIVSIVLIPYTLNSLFGGDEDDKEVRECRSKINPSLRSQRVAFTISLL